jgi:hypothetical protein
VPTKPYQPALQGTHPHRRGLLLHYPCHERGGLTVKNATGPAWNATVTAGAQRAATPDGPGVALNGSSEVINGGTGRDAGGSTRLSVWARVIVRASATNGTYSGLLSQWNDPTTSSACQRFHLSLWNNASTRPATSIDFNILLNGSTSSGVIPVQYQTSDLGRVWTLLGVYDGATVRLWARFPSGIVTNSVAATGSINVASPTNTVVGRLDGAYTNMIFIGGGIWWNRALTFKTFLELHRDPWGLITPPDPRLDAPPPPVLAAALLPAM